METISKTTYTGFQTDPGQQLTCIHCGEVFESNKKGGALPKLHSHMKSCLYRCLLKNGVYNSVLFTLVLNPNRTTMATLNAFLQDKEQTADALIGVLTFLKMRRQVVSFHFFEPKTSPEFTNLPNGLYSFRKINSTLSPEDKNAVGVFANNIFAHRHDHLKGA